MADRGFASRAFPVWAALRNLGRTGAAALVERPCAHARRFAEILAADDEISVLNDVVLNQVLVRVGDDDERTRTVAAAVQAGGYAWLGSTVRHGKTALRINVSDHATDDRAVTATTAAILHAVHQPVDAHHRRPRHDLELDQQGIPTGQPRASGSDVRYAGRSLSGTATFA